MMRDLTICQAIVLVFVLASPRMAWADPPRGRRVGRVHRSIVHDEAYYQKLSEMAEHNQRGLEYLEKDELDKAIREFSEEIRLDPSLALAYSNRAIAWESKGEFDKAIADCDSAIRLEAGCSPSAGTGFQSMSSRARSADGEHPAQVLSALAAAYAETGDFYQAVRYQKSALDLWTTKEHRDHARLRLKLYEAKKPYRDDMVDAPATKTPSPEPGASAKAKHDDHEDAADREASRAEETARSESGTRAPAEIGPGAAPARVSVQGHAI